MHRTKSPRLRRGSAAADEHPRVDHARREPKSPPTLGQICGHEGRSVRVDRVDEGVVRKADLQRPRVGDGQDPDEVLGRARVANLIPQRRLPLREREHHAVIGHDLRPLGRRRNGRKTAAARAHARGVERDSRRGEHRDGERSVEGKQGSHRKDPAALQRAPAIHPVISQAKSRPRAARPRHRRRGRTALSGSCQHQPQRKPCPRTPGDPCLHTSVCSRKSSISSAPFAIASTRDEHAKGSCAHQRPSAVAMIQHLRPGSGARGSSPHSGATRESSAPSRSSGGHAIRTSSSRSATRHRSFTVMF